VIDVFEKKIPGSPEALIVLCVAVVNAERGSALAALSVSSIARAMEIWTEAEDSKCSCERERGFT
jgi:hypothetical protein